MDRMSAFLSEVPFRTTALAAAASPPKAPLSAPRDACGDGAFVGAVRVGEQPTVGGVFGGAVIALDTLPTVASPPPAAQGRAAQRAPPPPAYPAHPASAPGHAAASQGHPPAATRVEVDSLPPAIDDWLDDLDSDVEELPSLPGEMSAAARATREPLEVSD